MTIQLIDRNNEMCHSWWNYFNTCKDVAIFNADIFDHKTDCIVSPANSFGFMNGGLDSVIRHNFGYWIQEFLQDIIKKEFNGEMLVGQAKAIRTKHSDIKLLICAPAMRVPMILPKDSVNIYLASKAIFDIVKKNNIQTVSISGLGTGVGQVPHDICARQMRQAYDDIFVNNNQFPNTWDGAQVKHQLLYTDKTKDLQW
jgi:O-acetyl-ADP-ribose deacetylase (regulator of RNase III)